jgi:predicted transcriptional regulator
VVILKGMKTAISLPAELFARGEAEAERLRISRSELYQRAIAAFLDRSQQEAITRQLDEVYTEAESSPDEPLRAIRLRTAKRSRW